MMQWSNFACNCLRPVLVKSSVNDFSEGPAVSSDAEGLADLLLMSASTVVLELSVAPKEDWAT